MTRRVLASFLLTGLWSGLALARAGGGEHYTGGGGSSGGDGGEIPIEIIWLLLRLTFEYPLVGIPLWIFVGFVAWKMKSSTPAARTKRAFNTLDHQRLRVQSDLHTSLQHFKDEDPAFDQQALVRRTEKLFLEVQEAWFRRDLEPVRRYLSDAAFRRFATLLEVMQAEGRRDAIADVRVHGIRTLRATKTQAFETVSFAISASMRDADVASSWSDEKARAEASHAAEESFQEIWTFVRRKGAKSVADAVWGQGGCPNCGAPFSGGAANKCEYCGAIVNSGNHDWVLTEITQDSEFVPHSDADRALAPLRQQDPDAAPEIIEDRALLVFWKWIAACALVEPKRLLKLARPEAFERVASSLASAPKDRVPLMQRPAVGGSDVLAVELDQDGFDLVHIDVRWSAAMGAGHSIPRRHVVILARKTGVKTDRGPGLSTDRCGNCQAPLTASESVTCEYCGHDLSSATSEWALLDIVAREAWHRPAGTRVKSELPVWASRTERIRLLQLAAATARADGVVDDSEWKLLKTLAKRWQVPWEDVKPLLSDHNGYALESLSAQNGNQAEAVLSVLIEAARVDGRVDRRERELIFRTADHLHADRAMVEELLRG